MAKKDIEAFNSSDEVYSSLIEGGENYAVRFRTKQPLVSAGTQCARFSAQNGTLTLSLYEWNTDYNVTVSGKPISERIFSIENGTFMNLEFPPLDAGTYLFSIHDGSDGCGFCGYINDYRKTALYINGTPADGGMQLYLSFDSDTDDCLDDVEPECLTPPERYTNIRAKNVNAPADWIASDGLGRLIGQEETEPRENKSVGLFYWDWHYRFHHNKPVNLNELMKMHPELKNDYDHPLWQDYMATEYFWDEPIYGYYTNYDKYVIRKQAELFAAAGIDFIVFDCTNGSFTWKDGYETLMQTFSEAKNDGIAVPGIVFMLNFAPFRDTHTMLRKIYTDIYRRGRFRELWYYHDGKPLIICHNDIFKTGRPLDDEILDFFTFRRNDPLYFTKEPPTNDSWGWLSVCPQVGYGKTADGGIEQMTVGVAQNASEHGLVPMNDYREGVFGRDHTTDPGYSYTYESISGKKTVGHQTEKAYLYGLNFQEQWDHAIASDPEIIFITGYNEWVAGRHREWQGSPNAFPDTFSDRYSRDIEPTKGELKDNFYYQMAANIRRFKGAERTAFGERFKTIDVSGDMSQWDGVREFHFDGIGSIKRDCRGFGELHYKNEPASNRIISTKCCFDGNSVYFYAKCENKINETMRLLISTGEDSPAWEGFDVLIGRNSQTDIEISEGGFDWKKICDAEINICFNKIAISVPRSLIKNPDKASYKWVCGVDLEGDISSLYLNGCVVPTGRFSAKI